MGCFLFQLQPRYHFSTARLNAIVSQLDPARRNVVEFRHASWLADIAFGAAFIPFALWASKHLAGRLGGSPWFQKFTDGIAGSDVMVAKAFLGKLERFGREAEGRSEIT